MIARAMAIRCFWPPVETQQHFCQYQPNTI